MKNREITITVTEEQYKILERTHELCGREASAEKMVTKIVSRIVPLDQDGPCQPYLFGSRAYAALSWYAERAVLASGQPRKVVSPLPLSSI